MLRGLVSFPGGDGGGRTCDLLTASLARIHLLPPAKSWLLIELHKTNQKVGLGQEDYNTYFKSKLKVNTL